MNIRAINQDALHALYRRTLRQAVEHLDLSVANARAVAEAKRRRQDREVAEAAVTALKAAADHLWAERDREKEVVASFLAGEVDVPGSGRGGRERPENPRRSA